MSVFFVKVEKFIGEAMGDISAGVSGGYASDLNSLFPAAVSLFLLIPFKWHKVRSKFRVFFNDR